MILVRLRCARPKCLKVLAVIDEAPVTWEGSLGFTRCPRCFLPSPRDIVDVMGKAGVLSVALTSEIAWSDLRPHVDQAQELGRTIDVLVPDPGH